MATWFKMISQEMEAYGDSWENVAQAVPPEGELHEEFDDGYGGTEGVPFTVWTKDRVYFPVCYDGSEWCGSVSRNPDGQATKHQGGG